MKKILIFLLIAISAVSLTGCGGKVDYVAKASLDPASYAGKNFLTHGIGEVNLFNAIDGDTAHFKQEGSNVLIKLRFLGIDTPESTGLIEEWGKAASKFTEEALTNATTIVLESNGSAPEMDGNGRHLSWVWVDGKLLNLMIVQEGLAKFSNVEGSSYNQLLLDADMQAQKLKLNMWSGKEDPDYFYGESTEVSLDYLRDNVLTLAGRRVVFTGIVSRQDELGAYVQHVNDEGEYSAIYVFASYQQAVFTALAVGNEVKVNGILSYHEASGAFQIVDVSYNIYQPKDEDIQILEVNKHRYTPVEITFEDFNLQTNPSLECVYVNLSNLTAIGGYNEYSDDANTKVKAMTIYCEDSNGNKINLRISASTSINKFKSFEHFVEYCAEGATFNAAGVVSQYSGNFQLTIVSHSDVSYN